MLYTLLTNSLLLQCLAAEQLSCSDQVAKLDSVSLLQSRGVQIDYGDESGPADSATTGLGASGILALLAEHEAHPSNSEQAKPTAKTDTAMLTTRDSSVQSLASGWSTFFVFVLLLCISWLICAVCGYMNMRRKEREQLEARVTSVLIPQDVIEEFVQPPEVLPAGGSPPMSSGWGARLSPFSSSKSPLGSGAFPLAVAAPSSKTWQPPDMPPPLDKSSMPVTSDTQFLVAKEAISAASQGGDLQLLAVRSDIGNSIRANVRKVDGDFYLDVSKQEGSSPSAMVRLTNKDAAPKALSFFGPPAQNGPQIYGPDGTIYGIMEISSTGAQLISSTTGLPVLTMDGDMKNSNFIVRTKIGLELAKVTCNSDKVDICMHVGADPSLISASVLTAILSFQM